MSVTVRDFAAKRFICLWRWLRSPAGICVVSLCVGSAVFGFIAYLTVSNVFVSSVLIGVATNFIGIVITISFVQHYISKSTSEIGANREREKFLRYNRFAEILIERFALGYYAVTHSLSNRKDENCLSLDTNVDFRDLHGMYDYCGLIFPGIVAPAIDVFYEAERELRTHFETMLDNVDFGFASNIAACISEFVSLSRAQDAKGAILGARVTKTGDKMESICAKEYIADKQHDWCKMFMEGKLKSNIMTPYVVFYYMILKEAELLKQYRALVLDLTNKTNGKR